MMRTWLNQLPRCQGGGAKDVGYPDLSQKGILCSRHKVARLMRQHGLVDCMRAQCRSCHGMKRFYEAAATRLLDHPSIMENMLHALRLTQTQAPDIEIGASFCKRFVYAVVGGAYPSGVATQKDSVEGCVAMFNLLSPIQKSAVRWRAYSGRAESNASSNRHSHPPVRSIIETTLPQKSTNPAKSS